MKISTKGRYALRLMIDLAIHNTGEPISLKDVARRQEISDKYLEQIISILNKAKFVKSVRGAQGGYSLRMKPEEYTVGMILRATEGDLAPVSCLAPGAPPCPRAASCQTLPVWERFYRMTNDYFDSISLAELLARPDGGDYVI